MFVDVWSDIVCPYCYLGFRQFKVALQRFEFAPHVVMRHHAFELDPDAPLADGTSIEEMLAAKYSVSVEQANSLNERLSDVARSEGMTWSLHKAQPTNTFDAHRLVALATHQERQDEMLERLFRAYFSEGLVVSDHATLIALADEVGVEGASGLLETSRYGEDVRHDEHLAHQIGIQGVPAFILDGRTFLSGAQGVDAMLAALRETWSDRTEVRV